MVKFKYLVMLLTACTLLTRPTEASTPPYIQKYTKSASELATKVAKLKDRYFLEYKDTEDLLDTCQIIVDYSRYSKNFDKNDITTLIIKEARFNQFAHNKKDGGRGLGQLTKIEEWHPDTLFWMTDPYDKRQNITGIIIVLEDNLKKRKSKRQAIKKYNGSNYAAEQYVKDFYKKKKVLASI
jgi:hypothetical protein